MPATLASHQSPYGQATPPAGLVNPVWQPAADRHGPSDRDHPDPFRQAWSRTTGKASRGNDQIRSGYRGRTGDPFHRARRILLTGTSLLTERQHARLDALLVVDGHVEVQATWAVYQRIVGAYRHPDRTAGHAELQAVIDSLAKTVPTPLSEVATLGRTLAKRAGDILAYFTRPGTSNGPTEAINGHLEHLRGTALGFRNLTNYIARALLESRGFRPRLPPDCEEPD